MSLPWERKDEPEVLIYGAGAPLFDVLEKYTKLREHISRVFEKERDKIGVKSETLGVEIEAAEAIKFLPAGTRIAIGEEDFPAREWEVRRINPYVTCISLEEAAQTAEAREKNTQNPRISRQPEKDTALPPGEEHIYLGLYDLARQNMRRLGQEMAVGRKAYILELKAQARGRYEAMEAWEQAQLLGQDYVETLYMRILKRIPNQQEIEGALDRLRKNTGKAELLKEVVKAGMSQGEK